MSSGDDIEAGRVTTAESTTHLLGAVPSEQDVGFNGVVVLRVGPQDGALHPPNTLDGIHGLGSNPPMPPGVPGGAGVVGFGGSNQGTGVRGAGGGGGTGVEAFGGRGGVTGSVSFSAPGAGLVARGGPFDKDFISDTDRTPNGPGAVAVAGGASLVPLPADVGNVGVFGQGGDAVAETRAFSDGTDPFVVGSEFAGAGIVGRGGVTKSNHDVPNAPVVDTGFHSAGVVGIAGGTSLSTPTSHYGAGVYGVSSSGTGVSGDSLTGNGVGGVSSIGSGVSGHSEKGMGVRGTSREGPGIAGESARDRGGIFGSSAAPQLHLQPLEMDGPAELSVESRPGDFLVTMVTDERGTKIASLHFCKSIGSWVKLA